MKNSSHAHCDGALNYFPETVHYFVDNNICCVILGLTESQKTKLKPENKMSKLTQAEQNKVNTLISLIDKELVLIKKMDRMSLRKHESQKNYRAYEKLEEKQEKVFLQFSEKYKVLPEHCASQVETYSGYNWEDFQED